MSNFKVHGSNPLPHFYEKKSTKKNGLFNIVSSIFNKLNSFFSIENSNQFRASTKAEKRRSFQEKSFSKPFLPSFEKRVDNAFTISEKNIDGERSILILSPVEDRLIGALRSFPTTGDGSCGFHSLFGSYSSQNRTFHLNNVEEKRSQFADWVENKFDSNEIPSEIRSSLHEYIKDPTIAPTAIKQLLKNDDEIKALADEFQKANRESNPNAEILLTVLISDPNIQSAYLEHLRNRSSYLLPAELGAAAVWAGKSLNIYQNQNAIGDGTAFPPCQYNEGKEDVIDIVLSQENSHFERAVYSPFS